MRIDLRGLLLTGAIALAQLSFGHVRADPAADAETPKTETSAEKPVEAAGDEPSAGATSEAPAEPFVPSESISADSAISFPVDI